MSFRSLIVPILCAGTTLMAQSYGDLNSLASAASRFAAQGVSGSQHPPKLDLREIKGQSSLVPGALMTTATDVQRWVFFYDANAGPGEEGAPAEPKYRSASCKCVNSVFSDFHFSAKPIPATKSLEFTWVAVGLDRAIQQLNLQGYVRGFSEVEVMRPDRPGIPDGLVYVFNCPWERSLVAVSAANGNVTWVETF